MGSLIGLLVARGLNPKAARFVAYAILIGLLVLLMSLAKCGYDRSIIRQHDAERVAEQAKADRKADAVVAEQRREDEHRLRQERTELEEVINATTANPAERRRSFHRCLRLQQEARRDSREPPTCI